MFNRRKIKELERRISDLEKPYKFQIGEKVKYDSVTWFFPCNERIKGVGLVVSQTKEFFSGMRINRYVIYKEKEKESFQISECDLEKA